MSTPTSDLDHQVCGLRFDKSDARNLRDLADRVKATDLRADVSTYEQAALAAETGEPLQVHFTDIKDVVEMVALYVLHGIKQPTIEELNGSF